MKILFWNLNENNSEDWVTDIIQENDIDIAVFAEYGGTNINSVSEKMNKRYRWHDGFGGCDKITLLSKSEAIVEVRREQGRYTLYSLQIGKSVYNLAGLHLPSNPSSNENDRKYVIREIVHDICEQEQSLNNLHTIVIGDFNCSPFDSELTQKDSFNAVLFKSIIESNEMTEYGNDSIRKFYNPIVNYISESTSMFGSFYYSSGSAPLYWYCYDQILVRRGLIDNIDSVEYVKKIKGRKLLKKIRPDSAISDHLPLIVNFK